ncbi:MAG: hypothetical protein AB7U20_24870 [Planctomycetaceae bacterium]
MRFNIAQPTTSDSGSQSVNHAMRLPPSLRPIVNSLVFLTSCPITVFSQDTFVSPHELEAGVIEARRIVRSGHLTIEFRGVYGKDVSREGTREFWFDVDRAQKRMDSRDSESGVTTVSCFGCAGSVERHVSYSDQIDPQMGPQALRIQSASRFQKAQRTIPDVRLLGLLPSDLLNCTHHTLDALAAEIDKMPNATVAATTLDGQSCCLVSREMEAPGSSAIRISLRTWFAEALGNSIVKKTVSAAHEDGTVLGSAEIRCTPALHAESGVWFPVAIEFRGSQPGGDDTTESLTIITHSFNRPLPENSFELSGINVLKPGTFVSWSKEDGNGPPPAKPPLLWNGSEIVHDEEFVKKNELPLGRVPEKARAPFRRTLVIVNLLALLGGAAYFTYVQLRKRAA